MEPIVDFEIVRVTEEFVDNREASHPNKDGLSAALWGEAVIHAYSCANAIKHMRESLPDWQTADKRDSGEMVEVIKMLDKPGGDLLGFATMLKRAPRA
jgi:hypothetical protein